MGVSRRFTCGARHAVPLLLVSGVLGCRHPSPPATAAPGPATDELAVGVVHRALPTGDGQGIDLIDVDLGRASVTIGVATEGVKMVRGSVTGAAYTPHEWLDRTGALAAVNGGYFGAEVAPGRKEFVGLLVQGGRVRHAAPPLEGHGSAAVPAGRYVRSAFGVTRAGAPAIAWAATEPGRPQSLRAYARPAATRLRPDGVWRAETAVGCGPRLIRGGRVVTTDRLERLVSPGPEPRTFVAYDRGPGGRPAHFVLGMASGMAYRDLADWLRGYFPQYDHTPAADAMCLDGGASTQLSYRQGGAVRSPRETGVTVPDAVVLLPP